MRFSFNIKFDLASEIHSKYNENEIKDVNNVASLLQDYNTKIYPFITIGAKKPKFLPAPLAHLAVPLRFFSPKPLHVFTPILTSYMSCVS